MHNKIWLRFGLQDFGVLVSSTWKPKNVRKSFLGEPALHTCIHTDMCHQSRLNGGKSQDDPVLANNCDV